MTLTLEQLRCPDTGEPLSRDADGFVNASGTRRWPIVRGVPRFVPDDAYVGSFSFEWNTHTRTQLDAWTGSRASERMLVEKTGLSADQVAGKLVLDAGIGAGRFADVLSRWGARVVGVDLSYAVEASAANFRDRDNVTVCQADIGRLPFAPASFDLIVSIGVLHHTPDTKAYFRRLVPLLKPGGEICIWVYPAQGDYVKRAAWIPFTSALPPTWYHAWCRLAVPLLLCHLDNPFVQYFTKAFPISNQGLGLENDVLDTFDGYSPRYHGIHNPDEVVAWFHEADLADVRTLPWDTAVRGRRPRMKDEG